MSDLYVIILASGIGQRFDAQTKVPKQLVMLWDKPIVCYSVENAIKLTNKENVILTYPKGMIGVFENLSVTYGWGIKLIEGGARRQDSVINAFKSIDKKKGIVLIHDSARPLASLDLYRRVYDCAKVNGACIPIVKANDTIKELNKNIIKKTLNRENIGFSQTPQGFRIELLRRIIDLCDNELVYTDEAMLMEVYGMKVHTVEGERFNIKLTFKEDLDIIKTFAKIYGK